MSAKKITSKLKTSPKILTAEGWRRKLLLKSPQAATRANTKRKTVAKK